MIFGQRLSRKFPDHVQRAEVQERRLSRGTAEKGDASDSVIWKSSPNDQDNTSEVIITMSRILLMHVVLRNITVAHHSPKQSLLAGY